MRDNQIPVTIVGFGSQAKAWALNLRDSKRTVYIALNNQSPSTQSALELGFKVINLEHDNKLLNNSKILVLLIPDDQHITFLEKHSSKLADGTHLIYAHGFSVAKFHLDQKYPQFSHSLLAPKAIASEVRYQYEINGKIGALYYSRNSMLENEILDLANDLKFTALFKSQFEEETAADLFSEQSLLCSVIPYLSLKSYNLLRKHGVSKEAAFMECFLELKSISAAFVTLGPEAFFKLISPNALIGSQKGRKNLLTSSLDQALEDIFLDIKNKEFYKEVEVNASHLREEILNEWSKEEMTEVFDTLKNKLIS